MPFKMRMQLQDDFSDLVETFRELGSRRTRTIVRGATQAAATPVMRTVKLLSPTPSDSKYSSGLYKKSMGKRVVTYRKSGNTTVVIGPHTGFKRIVMTKARPFGRMADPTKYAHLLELGHRIAIGGKLARRDKAGRPVGKNKGAEGGFVPGRHILGTALESCKNSIKSIMRKKMEEGIRKALVKRAAKMIKHGFET